MKGTCQLPPSPDLFVLAVIAALISRRPVTLSPLTDTPLVRFWIDTLKGCAQFEQSENSWNVTPILQDPVQFINIVTRHSLPGTCCVLSARHGENNRILFNSNETASILENQGKRYGIEIGIDDYSGNTGISIVEPPEHFVIDKLHDENDITMLLGLASGFHGTLSFLINTPFSSPFRTIASLFGFDISVKSTVERKPIPWRDG